MKLYFTYKQFPELAGYTEREKRTIWINFVLSSEGADWFVKRGKMLELVMFSGFFAGLFGGFLLIPYFALAPLPGGLVGLVLPMIIWDLATKPEMRRRLCEYMAGPEFQLQPMNQRARMFIRPLIWNRGEDDTQS